MSIERDKLPSSLKASVPGVRKLLADVFDMEPTGQVIDGVPVYRKRDRSSLLAQAKADAERLQEDLAAWSEDWEKTHGIHTGLCGKSAETFVSVYNLPQENCYIREFRRCAILMTMAKCERECGR